MSYKSVSLTQDTTLGFLSILLPAGYLEDMSVSISDEERLFDMTTHLNLNLLTRWHLLFLRDLLVPVVMIVGEVNLDTQLVTEFVDARALRSDDTRNKFASYLELSRLVIIAGSVDAAARESQIIRT